MKIGILLAVGGASTLHAGIFLFGGALVPGATEQGGVQEIELLSDEPITQDPDKQADLDQIEDVKPTDEPPPDAEEIIRNLEAQTNDAPALEAASLSAIEAALSGQGAGGSEFADALAFTSGGVIGGKGQAGVVDDQMEKAFSLAEIDQKPRAICEVAPIYPAELRSRKLEGTVTIKFIVDESGRVTNPRPEKATHPAFEKPALDAMKKWKFEPGIKGGQRVPCRVSKPFRFQPS